jgi:hypothetical protein
LNRLAAFALFVRGGPLQLLALDLQNDAGCGFGVVRRQGDDCR